MPSARVVWDYPAFAAWLRTGTASPQMALYRAATMVQVRMKALCPVSPNPDASSLAGNTVPGGVRGAGDFPLPPSGRLRRSCVKQKMPDGSWIIGPTLDYGVWVNDGTPPHAINSTGHWPLRNRVTGQVFGPHVNHPGTRPTHFIERSLEAITGAAIHV